MKQLGIFNLVFGSLVALFAIVGFSSEKVFAADGLDIKLTVQSNQTELKVYVKNESLASAYRTSTEVFHSGTNALQTQNATLDPSKDITLTFKNLTPLETYKVTVNGSPVSNNGTQISPRTFQVEMNTANPRIIEITGGSTGNTGSGNTGTATQTSGSISITTLPQTTYVTQNGKTIHSVKFGLTTKGVGREHGLGIMITNRADGSLNQMLQDVDLDEGYQEFFTFYGLKPLTTYEIYLARKQNNGGVVSYVIEEKLGEFLTTKDPIIGSGNTNSSGGGSTSGSGSGNNTSGSGGNVLNIGNNITINPKTGIYGATQCISVPVNECTDGKDNDGDGRRDRCGVDANGDGALDFEPDPACVALTATQEYKDEVAEGSLVPCTDKCSFRDVFILLNNLMSFVIKYLILPVMVIVIMYSGFKYLRAQGNPVKMNGIKKTFGKIMLGIILILCSWLIVSVFLKAVGYTDRLIFFETTK